MKNKCLSVFLAIIMIIGQLAIQVPASIFATDNGLDGDGSPENPYKIANADDLMQFAKIVNGTLDTGEEANINACGELTDNIDLTGRSWIPIGLGSDTPYSGTFDGKYFSIKGLNITADESWEAQCIGLFGFVADAKIRNLKVEGNLELTSDCGSYPYIGGLSAISETGSLEIQRCRTDINITVQEGANFIGYAGGLIGQADCSLKISECVNRGDISVFSGDDPCVGGLVGCASDGYGNRGDVQLHSSYNYGNINVKTDFMSVGGLMGRSERDLSVYGCYSAATQDDKKDRLDPVYAKSINANTHTSGDLFGQISLPKFDHTLSYTSLYAAGKDITYDDFTDEQIKNLDANLLNTAEMIEYLNKGSGNVYTEDNELAGGWPILTWELKKPIVAKSPEEEAYSKAETNFENAKNSTLKALDEGVKIDGEQYKGHNSYLDSKKFYSDVAWKEIESIYSKAKEDILNLTLREFAELKGKSAEEITEYVDVEISKFNQILYPAMKEMDAVPRKADEKSFEEKKEKICADLKSQYVKELIRLNGMRSEAASIWHENNGEILNELEEKKNKLDKTVNDGYESINASTNKIKLKENFEKSKINLTKVLDNYAISTDTSVKEKWDGKTMDKPKGSGSRKDPYKISTGAELAWFCTEGKADKNSSALLTTDIDLCFNKIENKRIDFNGVFDGENHIIHRLSGPLFDKIKEDAIIKNLKIAGKESSIVSHNDGGTIYNCETSSFHTQGDGGIADSMKGGYIENCRTWGLFLDSGAYNEEKRDNIGVIGGIVGTLEGNSARNGGLVRYCENNMQIEAFYYIYDREMNSGHAIGGIVGDIKGFAKIRECVNQGNIRGKENVGGIVGDISADEGECPSIAYVENTGDILGNEEFAQPSGVGGIIGMTGKQKYAVGSPYYVGDFLLENAYNTGNVRTVNKSDARNISGAIIGNWNVGNANQVRSSSQNTLWGKVDIANTKSSNTGRVDSYVSPVQVSASTPEKLEATTKLIAKLITPGNEWDYENYEKYLKYGEQYKLYNDTIMKYVRQIEEAKDYAEIEESLKNAETDLESVPNQFLATIKAFVADMESYKNGHIYDVNEKESIEKFIAEASKKAYAAKTKDEIANLHQEYLGTENIDGKLAEIRTYPEKTIDDLYNRFLFNKKYKKEDMTKIVRAYEAWKLKINQAKDVEDIEVKYADAVKALSEISATLRYGDTTAEQVKDDAFILARKELKEKLVTLADEYITKLRKIVGDLSTVQENWKDKLEETFKSYQDNLKSVADELDDGIHNYADLNEAMKTGNKLLTDIYNEAKTILTSLVKSASNPKAWNGNVNKPEGEGTKENPYKIGTAEELAWYRDYINSEKNSSNLYSILTDDIDLGYRSWIPIGSSTSYESHRLSGLYGTFDGMNHTIYGLRVDKPIEGDSRYTTHTNKYQGLFGYTTSNAEIKNLTVEGEIIVTDEDEKHSYAGGIVAYSSGTIENCTSRVNISGGKAGFVGGITGFARYNAKLFGCKFATSIDIIESSQGTGGIVGGIGSCSIEKCVNSGEISVKRGTGVGGIVGRSADYALDKAVIKECCNNGDISNDISGSWGSGEHPLGGVGGILGFYDEDIPLLIDDCYNTATISGSYEVGGILGGETYKSTYIYEDRYLTLQNSYNAGKLDVGTRTTKIGSMVGGPNRGRYVEGLYVLKDSCRWTNGWFSLQGENIIELEKLDIKSMPEIKDLVNSIAGLNHGHPLFNWQLEEKDNRQIVADYLKKYYKEDVDKILLPEQQKVLSEKMETAIGVITNNDNDVVAIIKAYDEMMDAMNKNHLLSQAKEQVKNELKKMNEKAIKENPELKDSLTALFEDKKDKIDNAKTGNEMKQNLDSFLSGIVDLLIDEATHIKVKDLGEKNNKIKDLYDSLTKKQQEYVEKYGKMVNLTKLEKLYNENLESLRQWIVEDEKQYTDIKDKIKSRGDDAIELLGSSNDVSGMTDVMNGYCAGVVTDLIDNIGYEDNKTTMGDAKSAINKVNRAQKSYDALSKEQRELILNFDTLKNVRELLIDYKTVMESLEKQCKEDIKKHKDFAEKINKFSDEAKSKINASVKKENAEEALENYKKNVAKLLADTSSSSGDKPGESKNPSEMKKPIDKPRTYTQSTNNTDYTGAPNDITSGNTAVLPGLTGNVVTKNANNSEADLLSKVERLIRAIGNVTLHSKDSIQKALDAYDGLSPELKARISDSDKKLLDDAVNKYGKLLKKKDADNQKKIKNTEQNIKPETNSNFMATWMTFGIIVIVSIIVAMACWFMMVRKSREKEEE